MGVALATLGTVIYATSSAQDAESTIRDNDESQLTGDLWGIFGSAGYAVYVSFGKKARQKVPTLVHLPGCVLVAMILVSGVAW